MMNNYNQPVLYDFIPHYKGDGLRPIAMTLKYPQTGNPVDLTGAKIKMQLRTKFVGKAAWTFSTEGGDALLVITDGANGKFEFPRLLAWDITASKYDYDIEITHADGFVCTYVRGVWAVNQDVTHGGVGGGSIQGGSYVEAVNGLEVEQEVVEILIEVNYQEKGDQGFTPYVGENDNWWINGEDTGFPSRGDVPVITIENGIWFIDGESTGQKAQGEDGKAIELGKSDTYLQWRYAGDADWINLVALEDIRGPRGFDGQTIVNINPDSPTPSARMWIGTQNQYDNQQPLPADAVTFILR